MITELCIDVIINFKQLKGALSTTIEHINTLDKSLPAWCQTPEKLHVTSTNHREQACRLISQLEYINEQLPREILVGPGIMAASNETIDALNCLNQAKNAFKIAMLKLKDAKVPTTHAYLAQQFEQLLPGRNEELGISMARMGMARIHLKQCYRRIPVLSARPKKISWTWANTRSIKRISVSDAEQMLRKHTIDAGIERQIKLLQGLDAKEELAIVQELAPHLRANIVMQNGSRVMVKGPVPIFYLQEDALGLPEFNPPKDKKGKDKERVIRKDVKINPEPFLAAIRAHRYYDTIR